MCVFASTHVHVSVCKFSIHWRTGKNSPEDVSRLFDFHIRVALHRLRVKSLGRPTPARHPPPAPSLRPFRVTVRHTPQTCASVSSTATPSHPTPPYPISTTPGRKQQKKDKRQESVCGVKGSWTACWRQGRNKRVVCGGKRYTLVATGSRASPSCRLGWGCCEGGTGRR